ncbi:hypothetical protein KIW84_054429, partial [Lathyrus oleraceus]
SFEYSSLLIFAIFLLLCFEEIMEGSSSSNIMDNQRLPQHENVTNVCLPAAEYEVPNPHGDDLTLDRETRRRLLNRGYSKTHREKKKCHIENLEDKKNTLSVISSHDISSIFVYFSKF